MLQIIQIITYAVSFFWGILAVLSFMDYLFGIDKLNPFIEKCFDKIDIDDELICPIVLTSFISLPCIATYLLTSSMFFYVLGAICALLSLGMIAVLIAVFVLIKVIEYIRNYFISLKKQ